MYKFCSKIAAAWEIALELWKRQNSYQNYGNERSYAAYAAVDPTTPPSRGERA